jgi:endonuclease-3
MRTDADGAGSVTAVESEAKQREQVAWVYGRLVATYGVPAWEPDGDALGGLIGTVLSQHTSDVNSERAYARLRERFPTWEAVRDAPVAAVADAIRPGGLAEQKAPRIQAILRALTPPTGQGVHRTPLHPDEERGRQRAVPATEAAAGSEASGSGTEGEIGGLEHALDGLSAMPLETALARLEALPGVGPKTAACVLLFSLGQPAFPVDTHVWRVARRLGLIGGRTTAEAAHAELARLIPLDWRHTLHVTMIRHGRQVCHARNPLCDRCFLRAQCRYYWEVVAAGR